MGFLVEVPLNLNQSMEIFFATTERKKGGCTVEIHYWNLKDDKRKRPDWTIYIQNSMLAVCWIVKVPDVSVLFRCENPDTFPCPSKGDLECMWESDSAQFFNVAMAKQSKYSALHGTRTWTKTTPLLCPNCYPVVFELNTLEHRQGFQIQCKCSNINHIAQVESNWMAPAATFPRRTGSWRSWMTWSHRVSNLPPVSSLLDHWTQNWD